jgi:hypothetical protein
MVAELLLEISTRHIFCLCCFILCSLFYVCMLIHALHLLLSLRLVLLVVSLPFCCCCMQLLVLVVVVVAAAALTRGHNPQWRTHGNRTACQAPTRAPPHVPCQRVDGWATRWHRETGLGCSCCHVRRTTRHRSAACQGRTRRCARARFAPPPTHPPTFFLPRHV